VPNLRKKYLKIAYMTRVNIEIEDELHKKARLNALLKNKTLIQFITEAIEEKLKKEEKK
tara:strand:+ start:3604 stop:3780 length:177 start_codon:yes stop_codon:yes gene_type:complete